MSIAREPDPTPVAPPNGPTGETFGWAALVTAAAALVAWMACCVVPMSLALVGVTLGVAAPLAAQRLPITLAAAAVLALGWVLALRRRATCGHASRRTVVLLAVASLLLALSAA